jgi:SMODS and SLOG-associating 2TM effector domain 1/Protein of unknown function (DUF4231)
MDLADDAFPGRLAEGAGRTVTTRPGDDPSDLLGPLGLQRGVSVILLEGDWPREHDEVVDVVADAIGETARAVDMLVVLSPAPTGEPAIAAALRDRGIGPSLITVMSQSHEGDGAVAPAHGRRVIVASGSADGTDLIGEGSEPRMSSEETITVAHRLARAAADHGSGAIIFAYRDARNETRLLEAFRLGWPLLVVDLAGTLSSDSSERAVTEGGSESAFPQSLLSIVDSGDLRIFPTEHSWEAFGPTLERLLRPTQVALRWAWERFHLYDYNATRLRRAFHRLLLVILGVGVLATLLALTEAALLARGVLHPDDVQIRVLHFTVLILPIALAVLLGLAARFRSGSKWVYLRAAAEAVKREIFRYRTGTGDYRAHARRSSKEETLTRRVGRIARALMQTEISKSVLARSSGTNGPVEARSPKGEMELSDLTPSAYIQTRVQDQLSYYQKRAEMLGRRLWILQGLIFVLGGTGTLLAALGLDVWIALSTALVGAITTYLGYEQVENSLVSYNQAASALSSLQGWWLGLTPDEQAVPAKADRLVDHAEAILQKEQGSWLQEMTDAMEELRAAETAGTEVGHVSDESEK